MEKLYQMKKNQIIILSLSLFLTFPCFSPVTKEKEAKVEKKFSSLQKSLLIPGWGQIAEKKFTKGILFLSSEIFCIYQIILYNHKGNKYYSLYKEADNFSDAVYYRKLTEKYDKKRNQFFLAAMGVWGINLIDMYLISKHKAKKKKKVKIEIKKNEHKGVALSFSINF